MAAPCDTCGPDGLCTPATIPLHPSLPLPPVSLLLLLLLRTAGRALGRGGPGQVHRSCGPPHSGEELHDELRWPREHLPQRREWPPEPAPRRYVGRALAQQMLDRLLLLISTGSAEGAGGQADPMERGANQGRVAAAEL